MIDIGPKFYSALSLTLVGQSHGLKNFMLKFYVKVSNISEFPNHLSYIWYYERYWFKILFSTILIPGHDL